MFVRMLLCDCYSVLDGHQQDVAMWLPGCFVWLGCTERSCTECSSNVIAQVAIWLPGCFVWLLKFMFISGAMDHKTHGSDHITDFESRIASFFGSAKNKQTSLVFINY